MGRSISTIECPKCFGKCRVERNNVKDLGAFWHHVWVTKCPNCGDSFVVHDEIDVNWLKCMEEHYIKWKMPKQGLPHYYLMLDKKLNKTEKDIYQEIKNNEIYESAIQEYVKEHYQLFGLSSIEGPFEIGPDFRGVWKEETIEIEVERTYTHYKQHGHHKQISFQDVDVLICLDNKQPNEKSNVGLPRHIWYIDQSHFLLWYMEHRIKYAKLKQVQSLTNIIHEAIKQNIFYLLNLDELMPEMEIMMMQDEYGIDIERISGILTVEFILKQNLKLDAYDLNLSEINMRSLFNFCKLSICGRPL